MTLKVIREGMGRGAMKQYGLLSKHWHDESLPQPTALYFNAFTRDLGALEERKRKGCRIVARVGGWHFDSAETTQAVLRLADGAIYVSDYTKKLAHKYFDDLPKKEEVITNAVNRVDHRSTSNPPHLLIRAGGLGYPVWKVWMLSRSLSIFCVYAIWPHLRERYPSIQLRVRGRTHHKIREKVKGDGIRFMEYTDDEQALHGEGSQSSALVHLIIGDHSPNTAAEMVGEGRPVIVLDKGGAKELVRGAGIVVPTIPSSQKSDLDVWWPLDEKTYRPNLDRLFSAVCNAVDNSGRWRERANKRAEEIAPVLVARKYLNFMGSL